MSRRSVFAYPDSDASFASAAGEPEPPSSQSSSSSSDENVSVELIDYIEPGTTEAEASDATSAPRFEEAIYVDSSSDTGQATVGSSTSSGKRRSVLPKRMSHDVVLSDSSVDVLAQTNGQRSVLPNGAETSAGSRRRSVRLKSISGHTDSSHSQESNPSRRSVRLKSVSGQTDSPQSQSSQSQESRPSRRSVRLKSFTGGLTDSTPSQESSVHGTIDKVCISSSADLNSESSEQFAEESPAVPKQIKENVLQVRLHRMSIDMANLQMKSASKAARPRKNSTHSETSNGPSPRKLRARTPSTKCLESFNLEDLHLSPRRRTTRNRTPSKRYSEHLEQNAQRESRTPKKISPKVDAIDPLTESDQTDIIDENAMKKSTTLYDQDADVAGQNLFAFRTPKKRDAMAQLAAMAPKTPQTPKTPKHVHRRADAHVGTPKTPKTPKSKTGTVVQTTSKTPSRVRSILKKELAKFAKVASSGSDFSADDSDDYKPDGDSDDSDQASDSSDDSESSQSSVEPKTVAKKRYEPPAVSKTSNAGRPRRQCARKQHDFVPESEDYFNHHTNKKAVTSDRTLDRMKTPRLPHEHLFQLLASTTLSAVHEQAITDMHQDYRQNFSKWLFTLNEGFSIILHGLGSKRNLLQQFHQDVLADHDVLVVNGFFPSLTIKDILDSISVDLLELTISSRNYHEIVDAIAEALDANPAAHIFLIVHNIDGAMLRNENAQLVLSRLAKINQIHMIASMDHINAPLLWDHTKLSNFNFSWWDVTTMLPYTEETAFENSMLVNQSGGLALSSMKNVFLSLTNNSRGIFLVIVRNQLTHKGNATFQGMPFKDLYSRCRENFLVSSDVALRSQLTEFIDHNLVKMKRTSDGIEHLQIPLDAALLEQFLELQENNN